MTTIYIKGRGKFKSKIRKALYKSILNEGDHYIEGNTSLKCELYWITSRITLREFKLAIGAKYIWKYRLKFYKTVEEMNPEVTNEEFTSEELELIEEYSN